MTDCSVLIKIGGGTNDALLSGKRPLRRIEAIEPPM